MRVASVVVALLVLWSFVVGLLGLFAFVITVAAVLTLAFIGRMGAAARSR